jgi:hypothetical protein
MAIVDPQSKSHLSQDNEQATLKRTRSDIEIELHALRQELISSSPEVSLNHAANFTGRATTNEIDSLLDLNNLARATLILIEACEVQAEKNVQIYAKEYEQAEKEYYKDDGALLVKDVAVKDAELKLFEANIILVQQIPLWRHKVAILLDEVLAMLTIAMHSLESAAAPVSGSQSVRKQQSNETNDESVSYDQWAVHQHTKQSHAEKLTRDAAHRAQYKKQHGSFFHKVQSPKVPYEEAKRVHPSLPDISTSSLRK